MPAFSARLDAALAMSARAHDGQKRKGTDVPYCTHPAHVAIMLMKSGAPEEVLIAALLHDTLEDTALTPAEIAGTFGPRVLELVTSMTQPPADGPGRSWRDVKNEAIRHLETGSAELLVIKCADTLHNTASLLTDFRQRGADAFARFKRTPEEQLWYYGEVARISVEKLGLGHPLASELKDTVDTLRRELTHLQR